jgi:uncharacterized protein
MSLAEPWREVLLFFAGALGGAINSVAGGGSFIVFPTMLLIGVAPVAANATTAVALWPAGLGSVGAYRKHLPSSRALIVVLCAASIVGGAFGAALLLGTSDATFTRILPWLMLTASSVFTFGPRIPVRRGHPSFELALAAMVQLIIATYGGYFGGGMGILMLATFTLLGMTHIHEMNALKVLLGILINGAAVIAFFAASKVVIATAIPAAAGAIAGGFGGASLARRMPPARVRAFVLVFAWGLTVWFFVDQLRK